MGNLAIQLRDLLASPFIKFKKYFYFIAIAALVAIVYGAYYFGDSTQSLTLRTWLVPFLIFVIIPIADFVLGEDGNNMKPEEEQEAEGQKYYKWITLLVLPTYAIMLVWGLWILGTWDLNWYQQLGWVMTIGFFGGAIGITTSHELIHKTTKHEQVAGGLLLSLVSYAGFRVEHVYGHHVHVSTIEDASSSRYNQTIYQFLPRAYLMNFINAWKIQKKRMEKKGQKFLSFKNELINYYLFSFSILVAFTLWQGWMGAVYFLATSFFAFTLLEIVNYIEHYGLHREIQDNGRYERVTPQHSWNANHVATNLFLFHLQRHSDHHANPKRRYQVLRNYDDSPQLPSGYAAMIVIAMIPPLWKKIMNPRVEAYYQGRDKVLDAEKTMLKRTNLAHT